jgi:hypothetical protein
VTGSKEILPPKVAGESNKEYKNRRLRAVLDYVRAYYLEHGHSRLPIGAVTVGGVDVYDFWASLRNCRDARSQFLVDELEDMAALGVDVSPEDVRLRRKRARENLAPPEQTRLLPYLQAIEAFAERHGHTNIPDHVTSRVGELQYGVTANAWRRAYAGGVLSPWLVKRLEGIPGWTWRLAEKPGPPEKVVLPEDTTQMRRPGLRQFLADG